MEVEQDGSKCAYKSQSSEVHSTALLAQVWELGEVTHLFCCVWSSEKKDNDIIKEGIKIFK